MSSNDLTCGLQQFGHKLDVPRFVHFCCNWWFLSGFGFHIAPGCGSFACGSTFALPGVAKRIGDPLAFGGAWGPAGLGFRAVVGGLHISPTLSVFEAEANLVVFLQRFGHQTAWCMNQHQALVAEIQETRRDLADLSGRVLLLTARVFQLENERTGAVLPFQTPPSSPVVINYTGGGALAAELPPFPLSRSTVGLPSPTTTSSVPSSPVVVPGTAVDFGPERVVIAEEAGRFLRRALDGNHRGTSGREKLRVSSRLYLLLRDHSGVLYNPAQLHRSWASIKPLVKPAGDCGTSVFIGWPTIQESKICCEAAGVTWPANE